ncbi:MAG TPA: hypothetical protein VGD78_23430, partial [Chthoniobacterales bacterium]
LRVEERSSSRTQKAVTLAGLAPARSKGENGIKSESSSGFMPDRDLDRSGRSAAPSLSIAATVRTEGTLAGQAEGWVIRVSGRF